MQFNELTDKQWELIRPSLPRQAYTGRPRIFDHDMYAKVRNSIERFFSWLKSLRRIQTRYVDDSRGKGNQVAATE